MKRRDILGWPGGLAIVLAWPALAQKELKDSRRPTSSAPPAAAGKLASAPMVAATKPFKPIRKPES